MKMKIRKTKVNTDIITREQRRKQVAQYLQLSMSETEIAAKLNVSISVICRDIQTLKRTANQFVYDLAKQDLAYFYKDTIDDINKARLNAWAIFYKCTEDQQKQLNALKVIIASNESMFNLLQQGPGVMSGKALIERISSLERSLTGNNTNVSTTTTTDKDETRRPIV